jgi:hypothetical protein
MKTRDLYLFLALELFAVLWAGLVFGLIPSRLLAGGLAGVYFVGSAVVMLWRAWAWSDKWRSLTIYPLLVHLFGIALPMLIMRFLNADRAFESVYVWGIEAPQLHRLSGIVFTALVVATVVDLIRVSRRERVATK